MLRVLWRTITLPVVLVLCILELLLTLVLKVSSIGAGIFISLMGVLIILGIVNGMWLQVGILAIIVVAGMILLFGAATMVAVIGGVKEILK